MPPDRPAARSLEAPRSGRGVPCGRRGPVGRGGRARGRARTFGSRRILRARGRRMSTRVAFARRFPEAARCGSRPDRGLFGRRRARPACADRPNRRRGAGRAAVRSHRPCLAPPDRPGPLPGFGPDGAYGGRLGPRLGAKAGEVRSCGGRGSAHTLPRRRQPHPRRCDPGPREEVTERRAAGIAGPSPRRPTVRSGCRAIRRCRPELRRAGFRPNDRGAGISDRGGGEPREPTAGGAARVVRRRTGSLRDRGGGRAKGGPGRKAPGAALATADLAAAGRPPLGNRARPGRPARCPGGRFPWATGGAGPRTELPVRAPLPTVAPSTSNLQGRPAPSPRATGRVGRAGEGPRGSARTVGGAEGRARERGPVELDTADPLARVTRAPGCRSCPRPPSARAALFRRRAAVGPSTGRRTSRTRAVWRRSFAAGRPWAAVVPRASRVRRRKRVAEAASTAATDLRTVGSSGEACWRSAQARGLAPSPACCPPRGSAARLPEPAAGAARERSERAGRRRRSSAVSASSECGLGSVPVAADVADHGRPSVNGRGPFPCRTARRRGGAAPACRRVHARG